ncbi:MAG: hypothetical protein QXZ06_06900, partial [Candidatus Jordarchaeales archaeon]
MSAKGIEAGTLRLMAEVAAEYQVPLLSEVRRNDSGTPLVSSIFDLARQASNSPFLVYVNGDILLLPELVQAIRQIADELAVVKARRHAGSLE